MHLIALLIALPLWAGGASRAAAQAPLKGEVTTTAENGFARLLFKFQDEIEAQVRLANNILTINFPRPVEVSIDRIAQHGGGYISVARRDPDGKGIRVALARKVTLSSMAAGERLFVDLLPDTWVGLPPGLPRDVIDELARRAREGERRQRSQRALAQQQKAVQVRVRAITQPTFTRYVFDLPELIGVSADNTREKLTLTFDGALRFDLADVKATLPPMIESIDSESDIDSALVRFTFSARVDVRTFREDNSFVVDVEHNERRNARQEGSVNTDELSLMAAELAERANERGKAAPKGSAQKSPLAKGAAAPPPAPPPQQPQSQPPPQAEQSPAQQPQPPQQAAAPPLPPAQPQAG
ncbi:MAG: hypothetical protein K2Y71_26860, partial [Xanthobacteraceae bacterium]|nr:hypothetical protein [Xanthobacteraceae bacterium]